MLGPTLVGHQVVQMGEPAQKRLLAPGGMMAALHHEELPVHSVMRLSEQRTGHGHLRVFQDGIPAGFLVLKPRAPPVAVGRSCRGGDVVGTTASPLAQGKHPYALPLARPVQQRVALGA
jgi:hypothetical protein